MDKITKTRKLLYSVCVLLIINTVALAQWDGWKNLKNPTFTTVTVTGAAIFQGTVTITGTVTMSQAMTSTSSITLTRATGDTVRLMGAGGEFLEVEDNNVSKFIIKADGTVGVGIATPQSVQHNNVTDSGTNQIQITNSTTGAGDATQGTAFGIDAAEQGYVWNYENDNLYFGTNNLERMMILAGGNIGFGDSSPDYPFEILSTTTPQFAISNDDGNDYATFGVSTAGLLTITTVDQAAALGHIALMPDGNVGIGTTAPRGLLDLDRAALADTMFIVDNDVSGDLDSTILVLADASINKPAGDMQFDVVGGELFKFGENGTDGIQVDASLQRVSGSVTANYIDFDNGIWLTVSSDMQIDPDQGAVGILTLGDTGDNDTTRVVGIFDVNTTQLRVDGGTVTQETFVVRKHVALSGATDATATNFFTITTTDETGSADGGMYTVKIHLTAGEATAASGAVNTAAVGLLAHFTRIMASAGTGANTAVAEISETASADEGTGAISAVTLTVVETSEFVQTIQLDVNTSGGTFDGFALVELVYSDFTTPPVIAGI